MSPPAFYSKKISPEKIKYIIGEEKEKKYLFKLKEKK